MKNDLSSAEEDFQYFEYEGNTFRRKGFWGGVSHILRGSVWEEYQGDRANPWAYGDRVSAPAVAAQSAGQRCSDSAGTARDRHTDGAAREASDVEMQLSKLTPQQREGLDGNDSRMSGPSPVQLSEATEQRLARWISRRTANKS